MTTALVTPAAASMNGPTASEPEPVDSFAIAVTMPPPVEGQAAGDITWLALRPLQAPFGPDSSGGTTVYFEAYAGSRKIASTTRTVSNDAEYRSYRFTIGDPDLVGGFDRLKIQDCLAGPCACSRPVHAHRDGWPEHLN